jgi:NlpC/P60 family putative phage cell wall peptidase
MDTDTRRRLLESGEWRQYIIDEARTWKGTPYQHKARIKGIGCDCGGIIYQIYTPLLGPFAPFPRDYAQDWAMHNEDTRYLDFIIPHVKQIPKAVPGGLALFKVGRSFSHAAICTEKKSFIHAWGRTQHGSVVENKIGFFRMGLVPRDVIYFDVDLT